MENELTEVQEPTTPMSNPIQETSVRERYGVTGRTNPELVQSMVGCFADDPLFERVVQFMESERAREWEEAIVRGR